MSWVRSIDWSDPDSLRAWAWRTDDEDDFDQGDEYLCNDWTLASTLLAFADDVSCPKRWFILGSLDEFAREEILRFRRDPAGVRKALQFAVTLNNPDVQDWVERQDRRLGYRDSGQAVDHASANMIATEMLFGPFRPAVPLQGSETTAAWLFDLAFPHFRERVVIGKATGKIEYWQWWPDRGWSRFDPDK